MGTGSCAIASLCLMVMSIVAARATTDSSGIFISPRPRWAYITFCSRRRTTRS